MEIYKIQDEVKSAQELQEKLGEFDDDCQNSDHQYETDIPIQISKLLSILSQIEQSDKSEDVDFKIQKMCRKIEKLNRDYDSIFKRMDCSIDLAANLTDLIICMTSLNDFSLFDEKFSEPNNKLIYLIMNLFNKNHDLIEFFLSSQVFESYCNIYSGFFQGWLENLLILLISSSEEAAQVFISHGIIDNIMTFFHSTLTDLHNLEKDRRKKLNQYWIAVIVVLEEFAKIRSLDIDNLTKIGMFASQFLSNDFLNLSKGLVARSISLMHVCMSNPNWNLDFNFDAHFEFFIEVMKNSQYPFKKPILDIFCQMCSKAYQWKPEFIIALVQEALGWCQKIDRSSIDYISSFFDFISLVLEYQFDLFDQLMEMNFFQATYEIIHDSPFEYQVHLYNLLLTLTMPQLWTKSYTFFSENSIIKDLILFMQASIDLPLKFKIISSLNQICMNDMNEMAIAEISDCIDDEVQVSIDNNCDDELSSLYETFLSKLASLTDTSNSMI